MAVYSPSEFLRLVEGIKFSPDLWARYENMSREELIFRARGYDEAVDRIRREVVDIYVHDESDLNALLLAAKAVEDGNHK